MLILICGNFIFDRCTSTFWCDLNVILFIFLFSVGSTQQVPAADFQTRIKIGPGCWEGRSSSSLRQPHSSDRGKHLIHLSWSFLRHVEKKNFSLSLQIVRHDRSMEQIVFPVPNICEYLTEESKMRVFTTTERDDQGSKVNDFFQQFDNLYNEMKWQKKIRSKL